MLVIFSCVGCCVQGLALVCKENTKKAKMVVEVDSLRMQGNFDPVLSLIPGIQGQNRSAGSYLPMQVHFSPVVASSQTCSVPITQISANPAVSFQTPCL